MHLFLQIFHCIMISGRTDLLFPKFLPAHKKESFGKAADNIFFRLLLRCPAIHIQKITVHQDALFAHRIRKNFRKRLLRPAQRGRDRSGIRFQFRAIPAALCSAEAYGIKKRKKPAVYPTIHIHPPAHLSKQDIPRCGMPQRPHKRDLPRFP